MLVRAKLKVALTALGALVTVSAESAHPYALANLPDGRGVSAERLYTANHLMTWYPWWLQRWICTFDVAYVGTTDAARFDFNQYLSGTWSRYRAIHHFEDSRPGHLHCLVSIFHGLVSYG